MAVTLLETGSQHGAPKLNMGVRKTIAQVSPILDRIPQKSFQGNAYSFQLESALPAAQWRAVGGSYTRGSGLMVKVTENVGILGNEVFVDNFELKVAANQRDLKARKFQEISRALAMEYDETFFEGDTHVNPLEFDGLRRRISGNQLLYAGDNGAALTLAMLNELLDTVIAPDRQFYMNRTLRRKITSLIEAQTGSMRIEEEKDQWGKQVTKYNGVPIHLVERMDDGSTILGFDETRGNSSVTSSIYVVSYGNEERVFGLMGAGGSFEAEDLGVSEVAPGRIGRVEFYPGLVIAHPRCVGRLAGILNS